MGNTLQPNPSNAADDFVQPDWNSKSGEGVAPASDDSVDLQDNYAAQREGAKARLESKNDPS
jgi:hypothetical protein